MSYIVDNLTKNCYIKWYITNTEYLSFAIQEDTDVSYDKGVYRSLTQILQFGINMLVPIILCTFLGIYLDRILGTSFIVIILFFLGAIAGGRNVYIFAKQIYNKPPVHDDVKVRSSNYDESKKPKIDKGIGEGDGSASD